MTHLTAVTAAHATDRLADWQTGLRAENKAPGTVTIYVGGVTRYPTWCAERDHPPMSRAALNSWIAGPLDAGAAPGTARVRQLAVRRFASWLAAGGEIPADPFPGVRAPRVEPPLVEPLPDDELRALLATCAVGEEGTTDALAKGALAKDMLHRRRDEAIIRLMFETAIRSGELISLQLDDLDLIGRLITIRRGKGGRGRVTPIGHVTTEALLTYLDARERHPLAHTSDLRLGHGTKRFGTDGLYRGLRRRAQLAEVHGFRPHRLRHTAAHRWLAAGGSESGLIAIAGWTRTDMLIRDTRPRLRTRHPRGQTPQRRRLLTAESCHGPGMQTQTSKVKRPESQTSQRRQKSPRFTTAGDERYRVPPSKPSSTYLSPAPFRVGAVGRLHELQSTQKAWPTRLVILWCELRHSGTMRPWLTSTSTVDP